VLVIEDLISTGKSSLQVVDVLRNAGVEVVGMVSIFTYGFAIAEQAFADAGVLPFVNGLYAPDQPGGGERAGIDAETETLLLQWRNDPG
jgi:orotate phosphoribosyltransferase